MDLKNCVTCQRCMMEMRETILQDIPTCRVSNYYCEKCAIMVSIYSITESRLEEINNDNNVSVSQLAEFSSQLQEVHPMEDK